MASLPSGNMIPFGIGDRIALMCALLSIMFQACRMRQASLVAAAVGILFLLWPSLATSQQQYTTTMRGTEGYAPPPPSQPVVMPPQQQQQPQTPPQSSPGLQVIAPHVHSNDATNTVDDGNVTFDTEYVAMHSPAVDNRALVRPVHAAINNAMADQNGIRARLTRVQPAITKLFSHALHIPKKNSFCHTR